MDPRYEGIVEHIQRLSAEQHQLYVVASQHALTPGQRKRLSEIRESLKNLWLDRKRLRHRFRDPINTFIRQTETA